ncbi:MAG: hypothetical protein IKF91_01335 [Bacilli bacterium]|nr:hypothetical protein [Bacilli bacterium]
MNNEQMRDARLELEFVNPAYDIIDEAVTYTMKKYMYKEYDLVKLVMMIYKKDYSFISNDFDYRMQVKLLDEYFNKEYGHSIITFEMIKYITSIRSEEKYSDTTAEISYIEKLLRTNDKNKPNDLTIFSGPIKNKKYDDLMNYIEKNISMKYAVAFIYDKIKYENS